MGMLDFCFVSAVLCPSLLIGVTSVLSVPKDFIYNSFFHHILLKILTKDIVFLVTDSCRATPRNLHYNRGRLKRLERCLFLLFLDNLPVVFF